MQKRKKGNPFRKTNFIPIPPPPIEYSIPGLGSEPLSNAKLIKVFERRFPGVDFSKGVINIQTREYSKLQISAPEAMFQPNPPKNLDPIVLQPVYGGYLVMAKWGDEANDPELSM